MTHVDAPTSSQSSILMPAFDCGLQLLVMVLGTAGLGWLELGPSVTDPLSPATSKQELRLRLTAASQQADDLQALRDARNTEAVKLEKQLSDALADHRDLAAAQAKRNQVVRDSDDLSRQQRDSQERLRETLRKQQLLSEERQRLEADRLALAEKLRQLEQTLRELERRQRDSEAEKARVAKLQKDLEELEQKLRKNVEDNRKLREDIAEEAKRKIDGGVILVETPPRFQSEKQRKALFVVLSLGTVTPIREPYYTVVENANGSQTARMARRGGDAGQALAKDSDFMKVLDRVDPRTQYVFLLVDSRSFETFRAIRAELRRRNIENGWQPTEAETFNFVDSGGMDTGPQ